MTILKTFTTCDLGIRVLFLRHQRTVDLENGPEIPYM